MKVFSSPHQFDHAPERELQNGEMVPFAESPERLTSMRAAFADIQTPKDFGLEPIAAIHAQDYLNFLQTAFSEWTQAGRPGDALPYVFPIRHRKPLSLHRIDAKLGQYAYDCGTPIAEGTWRTVYWCTQTALNAMANVCNGAKSALALCRPPGHHAGRDYFGGYCYLNSVSIAAQMAIDSGAKRVAILDVDYHHGNGTQDIFYDRSDVMTISLHADPATDYPFYWGHADEKGTGAGKGFNLNLPMPRGMDWALYQLHLDRAIDRARAFAPDCLLVPFGADTFRGDPISFFHIDTADYAEMGARIAKLDLPTLILTEGGYNIEDLGHNVRSFVSAFMS